MLTYWKLKQRTRERERISQEATAVAAREPVMAGTEQLSIDAGWTMPAMGLIALSRVTEKFQKQPRTPLSLRRRPQFAK